MPKSALFNLYSDKLACCSSADELVALSREITQIPFKAQEKTALAVSCLIIAKKFDKQDKKLRKAIANEDFSMVGCDQT